jgi:L-ascorbate metabolism protein UlaG (beta-lactamase superfamily)
MKPGFLSGLLIVTALLVGAGEGNVFEKDVFKTSAGDLAITFIGHGTLMLEWNGLVVHVDPVGRYADYSALPKADLILVTHEHGDHFDPAALEAAAVARTQLVCTARCAEEKSGGAVMKNGESRKIAGVTIDAVPAYNIVSKRPDGQPFHPKGEGNGYRLTLGGLRIYIAGDTELIPEMKEQKEIDVAFLPMNLPYTMSPEMAAEAARTIRPKVLYPYHFGGTDTAKLVRMLEAETGIEVRIRKLN